MLSHSYAERLIEQANINMKNYEYKAKRENLRSRLIEYMFYVKGELNLEQLDALNSWVDHSNLGMNEILEKLEEN